MNIRYTIAVVVATALFSISSLQAAGVSDAHAGESARQAGNQAARADRPLEPMVRDAWLDGKIESALLFNTDLNSFAIDTKVREGVVHLSGAVDSAIDKELAAEIARAVEGVTEVRNDLVVGAGRGEPAAQSGDDIEFRRAVLDATKTARVKTRLIADDNTDGLAINVDTLEGIVTLTGTVGSDDERARAVRVARNTDGVTEVRDNLAVEAPDA